MIKLLSSLTFFGIISFCLLLGAVVGTTDPYFCVPNSNVPTVTNNRQHKLYDIPTPFPVSFGGYVPDFPECSLEGVVDAVDSGYRGIQVTAAYLLSGEVALIGYPTLYDYVGGDETTYVWTLSGDEFAKKVFKKTIEYGNYEYNYLGVYRATFLYEIFDAIPNFKTGVFFISVLPEIPAAVIPEDKVLGKLTMQWIKFVIDAFQAWDRVIIYDVDATKSLDIVRESGCSHLFGYEAYASIYDFPLFANDVQFSHKGIHPLRPCASNFSNPVLYVDFMLDSGSMERSACISMTIAEMDTFTYKQQRSPNPGSLSAIIRDNYYSDTSNYYVGLFADPYQVALYQGDTRSLNDDMRNFVSTYGLEFYITPVEYWIVL